MVDIDVISNITTDNNCFIIFYELLATGTFCIAKSFNVRLSLIKTREKTSAILLETSAKFDMKWLARAIDVTFKWKTPAHAICSYIGYILLY